MTEQPNWLQFYVNEIAEELEGIESITQVATAIRDYKESSVTLYMLKEVWDNFGLDDAGFRVIDFIDAINQHKGN